jgi:hypothetical protein
MGFRPHRPLALLGAGLLGLGLAACHFGRNMADDCWVDRGAFEAANRYRAGLRARNVPAGDGAWALAETRIAKSRQALRACEDGAAAAGRPDVADLSHGHPPAAAGGHGA